MGSWHQEMIPHSHPPLPRREFIWVGDQIRAGTATLVLAQLITNSTTIPCCRGSPTLLRLPVYFEVQRLALRLRSSVRERIFLASTRSPIDSSSAIIENNLVPTGLCLRSSALTSLARDTVVSTSLLIFDVSKATSASNPVIR